MRLVAVVLAAFATEVHGGAAVVALGTADVEGTCLVTTSSIATALGSDRGIGVPRNKQQAGAVRPIAE